MGCESRNREWCLDIRESQRYPRSRKGIKDEIRLRVWWILLDDPTRTVILTYPERESENEKHWHPISYDGSTEQSKSHRVLEAFGGCFDMRGPSAPQACNREATRELRCQSGGIHDIAQESISLSYRSFTQTSVLFFRECPSTILDLSPQYPISDFRFAQRG
jgi:hypothetical protein